ncbi:MAG: DUF1549 domain-containing protein [Planctomycetota bacterium]
MTAGFFFSPTTLLSGLLLSVCSGLACAQDPPQDFAHAVLPVLKKHCIPCHGGREARGSFSMNTRELLVDSGYVIPGKPDESRILQRILSDDPAEQMPPADQLRLTVAEIAVLRNWIGDGVQWEPGFSFAPVAWEPPLRPRRVELPPAVSGREHPIDRILDAQRQQSGLAPLPTVSDEVFLRRVYLDLTGLLPTPDQRTAFLNDTAADRRERLVNALVQSPVVWADHWLTFFNDLLRNDYSGTGFITGGRQQISGWLYDALLTNKPFDEFARELIAPATPASRGYIDGIRWRGEVSAGQTVEIQFAQSVAQSFLGINLKCASCHDSFIDRWKLDEAWGMAAIYSERPLQIHRCDKPLDRQAQAAWLFPELGAVDAAAPRDERLRQLAALMTHPENGRFTRTIVNRIWYRLTGRGIVHPLDAMQSPPWNADLLDYLAMRFADDGYDLKKLAVLIASSAAYQAETVVRRSAGATQQVWQGPFARRLTAEQFIDGVWQLTEAAPTAFDAPVIRVLSDAQGTPSQSAAGSSQVPQWIWGSGAANGVVPASGESISLRKVFEISGKVTGAAALITCDNSFVLYVNGREADRGDNWAAPRVVNLRSLLKPGENTLLVAAVNAGSGPNPAGLYVDLRIRLESAETQSVISDASWTTSSSVPSSREGRAGTVRGPWTPVVVVPALDVWSQAVNGAATARLQQALSGDLQMVRASLLKNDFLMRSLGRPQREQIVSMRPEELTTLEALDLSNGTVLADYLRRGAALLHSRWAQDPAGLAKHLCEFAWSREATADEQSAMLQQLGESPEAERIEDLIWAVIMTPEFLLVR